MFLRAHLPLLIAFFIGTFTLLTFFLRIPAAEEVQAAPAWLRLLGNGVLAAKNAVDRTEQYLIIVAGFALLLGIVNVVQNNVRKIERKAHGWPYALALLSGLFAMGGAGILGALPWIDGGGLFEGITTNSRGERTAFDWMTEAFFRPLQATMFSLLAFYIASAAFRAFRARNVEASILLLAAVLVMLGRVPLGEGIFAFATEGWLVEKLGPGSTWLPRFTEWLMAVPNTAAQRGILIGAALGAASLSLRVILGIERSYLGIERQ